jgi:CAAX protease family protein
MELRIRLLIELSFFWGAVSLIAFLIAWKRNFFKISNALKNEITINFTNVLTAFFIYLIAVIIVSPIVLKILSISLSTHSILAYISISNMISFFLIALLLSAYYLKNLKLFEANIKINSNHFSNDFKVAFIGWAVATPFVLFFSQVSDLIISKYFQVENIPDQIAVNYVKMSMGNPLYFLMAFFTIVVLAPITEEILFRGFLQTWLKKHVGIFLSIIFTSIIFTFFHFSTSQKIGNIVVLSALFPLAFFLSFIYEKQKTLICPIFLHAIFNLSSILSLMLIGK